MNGLPNMGELVTVSDPMGYSGEGTVVRVQTTPHHAVFVHMHTITDRTDQSAVGREIWVLAGNIEVAP